MRVFAWIPAALLTAGVVLVHTGTRQQRIPLAGPLDMSIPRVVDGFGSQDLAVSPEEQAVAGMSSFLYRVYRRDSGTDDAGKSGEAEFSLYIGYYESQTQGRTIHSPRNCLPGAGWEPLTSTIAVIATTGGGIAVNRYVLQNGNDRLLALYWYQGRGRVEANEYRVKWDLLRDAAIRGRTEEALVRILVPIRGSEDEAFETARRVATVLLPAVDRALPGAKETGRDGHNGTRKTAGRSQYAAGEEPEATAR
jgi:EpsI family protein